MQGESTTQGLRASVACLIMLACLLASIAFNHAAAQGLLGDYSVSSPDGTISVVVTHTTTTGGLSYRVTRQGLAVIDSSTLGINTSIGDFSSGLSFVGRLDTSVNESYTLPGRKRAVYTNQANELVLRFSKNAQEIQLVVRAYNDGMAYRYRFPGTGSLSITSESSFFNLPDAAPGWAQSFTPSYEAAYPERLNFNSGSFSMPILARLNNSLWALLSESDIGPDYHTSHFGGGSGSNLKVVWPTTTSVTGSRPFNTPWRQAGIGSLATIFESTLTENLSAPSKIADTSWIKPGISAWSWWSGDSQSDYNTQVRYVDFAAAMGWEYYLCDAGWQASWMPTLISYANSKGVGILIWDDWVNVDTESEMRARFSQWATWGAKGVKIDYFYNDSQSVMRIYDKIAQVAAEYKLLVNYHGSTKPNGMSRRWPHVLTQEGVYGAEQYKPGPGPSAAHNVTLVFTRNAIGPMDYTPVTYSNNRGLTTWAHQTALSVVFSSYIQHMADRWSTYDVSVAKPFLRTVPAVWDESKLIEGYPAQYSTVARKSGSDWYIGAIVGGGLSRTATIPLAFLDSGVSYTAQIYRDGSTDTQILVEQQSVTSASVLSIPLRVNGGVAIRLIRGGVTPTATRSATPGGPTATRSATPSGPTATRTPTAGSSSNLALNRPASASASCNSSETAGKAVNGSVSGGTSDKWCDNSSTSKWLRVDLGSSLTVGRFVLKHAGAGGESTTWNTRAFSIQTSVDGATWTTVVTVSANTASTSSHTITPRGARYVRLNVQQGEQSASTARIYELEVYSN